METKQNYEAIKYQIDDIKKIKLREQLKEGAINRAERDLKILTETELVTTSSQNLIQKEKIKELKIYYGKTDLEIDLDTIRDR